MKYSRNAKNRANTGEWLVRCTLDSSKLIRNTSGRFMIDRSITECLSSPFIWNYFARSFQSRLGIRLENPIYDFFRVKIYLELGVSHWREICIEMKEILLFANSSRRSSWKRISFSFAREKGRRERKIGGEREEEEEEKKELPRVWGAVREHVYTLFVHIPLTIYIGVRAVWIDNDRLPGTWPPLRRFFPRFVSRWLCLSAYLRRYM